MNRCIYVIGYGLVAMALIAAGPADRWIDVANGGAGPVQLDRDSVARNGTTVSLWTRQAVGTGILVWNEFELDCVNRTQTLLAFVRDDRGSVSHNVERPHRRSASIDPGSIEARLAAIVCPPAQGIDRRHDP